jgi:hypothetical protein
MGDSMADWLPLMTNLEELIHDRARNGRKGTNKQRLPSAGCQY